ncbi:GNAT family N-acetyltransferase [Reinekea sp.]|jgi:RimJ/RimL family protein N-acetyltransferase|uniref:GNAT family N-acetyltransferase n=1 Tax=Reinekea sp. TaxID=1970455 RepID=UPI0039896D69
MLQQRLLNNEDQPSLIDLLMQHASTSLFILSNINKSQIAYTGALYEGRYYGAFEGSALVGVLVHYWNGNIMAQGEASAVENLWQTFRTELTSVKGFVGRDDLCLALRRNFDSEPGEKSYSVASQEMLYELELNTLNKPELLVGKNIDCKIATEADLVFLIPWRVAYNIEALGEVQSPTLLANVTNSLIQNIKEGTTYVLWSGDTPLATTNFNAKTNPYVQVGGVWTPVELRGKGYARAVVAASLLDAVDKGFSHSILFTDTANIAAQKAYESIGYRHCGEFGLYILAAS